MTRTNARVLVISERPIFRECLVCYLKEHGIRDVAGAVGARTSMLGPTLVLVDLAGRREDPRQLVHQLRARWPRARVVALGTPAQLGANAGEADGCLALCSGHARDIAAMARAPRLTLAETPETALQRRRWSAVTERERHVLDLLACGADNLTLAASLGITERTVKAHLARLFRKLHATNRTELALTACHAGLSCAA